MMEPRHVDESQLAGGFRDLLSEVATKQQAVILQRGGADLAAVVPLAHLDLIRDSLARQEAERISAGLNWEHIASQSPPPQTWFDEAEPKPF